MDVNEMVRQNFANMASPTMGQSPAYSPLAKRQVETRLPPHRHMNVRSEGRRFRYVRTAIVSRKPWF